jgi:hypothetical protein
VGEWRGKCRESAHSSCYVGFFISADDIYPVFNWHNLIRFNEGIKYPKAYFRELKITLHNTV